MGSAKDTAEGLAAEEAVARWLRGLGWEVLAHRWSGGGAELDLVARQGARLRFVEVKLRAADDPVGAECVDARKVARLERAAEAWLADWREPVEEACIAVAMVTRGERGWRVELLDDPT